MKAQELAEKLMKNPDFDVNFIFTEEDESTWTLTCRNFENIKIVDIWHNDGIIVLSGKEEKKTNI